MDRAWTAEEQESGEAREFDKMGVSPNDGRIKITAVMMILEQLLAATDIPLERFIFRLVKCYETGITAI